MAKLICANPAWLVQPSETPEPVSPSVVPERWAAQYASAKRHETTNPKLEIAAQILRELGTAEAWLERCQNTIEILEAELKLRNQDIADLQLTNRNLSRKIAYEMNRSNGKGSYGGIHGS